MFNDYMYEDIMPKTERIQFLASSKELERLDEWMFENELRSRSQALRCLILNRCGPDKMLFGVVPPNNLEQSKELMKQQIKEIIDQGLSIFVDFVKIAKVLGIPGDEASGEYIKKERFYEIWKQVKKWENDLGCMVVKFGTEIQNISNREGSLKEAAYKGVIFVKKLGDAD